ncbi:MAG TPA: response regulator [Candidatus Didemnitutus sp.]|nr:response regulator [Candidatus Didemnitutus sp.]
MVRTENTVNLDGPAALRLLGQAFAHLHDFDRFVAGLQTALDKTKYFERSKIALDSAMAGTAPRFAAGALTLPLGAGEQRVGTLRVSPDVPHSQFGAEDLHLLAGLADFLSAVLTQSLKLQDAQRSRELLRFLLNQAPIGLAAYTPDGRLLVANDLAAQWLGEAGPPFMEIEVGPGSFHMRAGGKLIFGEARRSPDGVWVVALHDLTPGQVRLMESLQRETFRGLVEHRPVSFAVLESPNVRDGVLRQLPALRHALSENELVGPYDANRLGVVLAGRGSAATRLRLRNWGGVFPDPSVLKVGLAELGRDGTSPEALLETALRRGGPFGETTRPTVLVHDSDMGVADSVALILNREYRVVKSTEFSRTREQMRREEFDVLLTDLDLRGETSGLALAHEARKMQPGLKLLFTSVRHAPHDLPPDLTAEGAVVLQKPFSPDELKQALKTRLGT